MGNFSRNTFDKSKHYVGVRLQQGVPLVDADWNELEDIRKYELKNFREWFVGNGVPSGNDGFRILAIDGDGNNKDDFIIKGGDGTPEGAGRILVDGWELINESNLEYTGQPLYNTDNMSLNTPADEPRQDLVYLDTWEREVDDAEDPDIVNEAIGVQTCLRLKREWVVRVAEETTTLPTPSEGHHFYPLAILNREAGVPSILQRMIEDLRDTAPSIANINIKGDLATLLTGNVSVVAGTNTVVGDESTKFTEELKVGDAIKIANEIFNVTAITADDNLTIDSNPSADATGVRAYKDSNLFLAQNGDGQAKVVIDKSGNVGIGTTSLGAGLDVQKEIAAVDGSAKGINFQQTLSAGADNDALTALHINPTFENGSYTDVKHYGLIVENGNVGIGTTSSGGTGGYGNLEVAASNSGDYAETLYLRNNAAPSDGNSVGIRFGTSNEATNGQAQIKATETGTGTGGALSFFTWKYTYGMREHMRIDSDGNVGIGTTSPEAKLHVAEEAEDSWAFIRASNFNPVPAAYWPDFDASAPYLLKNALWVGWDDTRKAWKYYKESDNDRGITDPGNPAGWAVNGENIGYFDGDLASLPPGTHANNRYNPRMMAARCDQDDIQVKVGAFWVDKYACRIIDVGFDYSKTNWKDDSADMQTSGNDTASPYWMAFSQKDRASTGMTWFIASQAAANAGKRLLSNAEWQTAALGTARSEGNKVADGSTWGSVGDVDVARYGVVGMAGNVWEWVADWGQYGEGTGMTTSNHYSTTAWGPNYGNAGTWNIDGTAYTSDGGRAWVQRLPAALIRGGCWSHVANTGVFAVSARYAPSIWSIYIGFRCAR